MSGDRRERLLAAAGRIRAGAQGVPDDVLTDPDPEAAGLEIVTGEASVVPSGFRIETFVLQQTGVTFTLTRWAAVPANVSFAFWPGVVVVTVTAAPPGAIVPLRSAGTS